MNDKERLASFAVAASVLSVCLASAFMVGYAVGTESNHPAAPVAPPAEVQEEPPAPPAANATTTPTHCTPWNPNDHTSAPSNPCQ